jgi:predicted MFS family arabinose efflux permease
VAVGGSFLVVISVTNTAVQVIVADRMRGRVIALRIMAFTGAYPLGALAQAAISDVIGPRWTVAGAGALLVGAALFLRARNRLDHLDDPHDESDNADGDGDGTPAPGAVGPDQLAVGPS